MFKGHTNGPITYGVKEPRGTKVTNKRGEEEQKEGQCGTAETRSHGHHIFV